MRFDLPVFALFVAATLGGCAATSVTGTSAAATAPAAEGSAVAIGQPVRADDLVLTPIAVAEDSRCAEGTQCIWAGRVVVTTQVDGPGWRETLDLTATESTAVRNHGVILATVTPERRQSVDIAPGDYRFVYMVE